LKGTLLLPLARVDAFNEGLGEELQG